MKGRGLISWATGFRSFRSAISPRKMLLGCSTLFEPYVTLNPRFGRRADEPRQLARRRQPLETDAPDSAMIDLNPCTAHEVLDSVDPDIAGFLESRWPLACSSIACAPARVINPRRMNFGSGTPLSSGQRAFRLLEGQFREAPELTLERLVICGPHHASAFRDLEPEAPLWASARSIR